MTDNTIPPITTPVRPPVVPDSQPPVPPRPPRRNGKRNEGLRNVLSTLSVLLIAPLIALLLTAFVFQSYQVDGQSMETTLQDKNRLIVWKVPRTWARITRHAYIPHRGDIVIFTDEALSMYGEDPGKQLIKRVIALPGERVVVKDNTVTVYNKEHPQGFDPDTTLPYGQGLSTVTETPGEIDITVPAGQVFVMGDNRKNSLDSRLLGPVDANHIIGKLAIRVMPLSEAKRF